MGLQVVAPPSAEPIGLEDAKKQLRVSGEHEDAFILTLISVARELVERDTCRQILTATFQYTMGEFPNATCFELPRPPLQSVDSIQYIDSDGATQTLPTDDYDIDLTVEPGVVYLKPDASWPDTQARTANSVQVNYTAGWSDSNAIPVTLLHGIRLAVAHLYEHREPVIAERTIVPQEIPGLRNLITFNTVPFIA